MSTPQNELSPNPWADPDLPSGVQALSLADPPDALDAPSAWADVQGHPPPRPPPGHSRSSTHDLSHRPSSPDPQPSVPSPAFPSLAAIARSFSIPSVVRPRTRPLSMDSAKPIPTPSPTTADSFAAQQQAANVPSPLSKPLSLQPDPTPHSAPTTRSATPPSANDSATPPSDKDPQFDFQTFLDQMKSRGAEPVAKYLRSQVFLSPPSCSSQTLRVQFSQQFRKENVYRQRSSQAHQRFLECMNMRLRSRLIQLNRVISSVHRSKDERIRRVAKRLRSRIRECHGRHGETCHE